MTDINECPNCGATMNANERHCKYCGTANPRFIEKKSVFKSSSTDNFRESLKTAVTSTENRVANAEINWVTAILLLIFCWPIGLIYIIVKCSK